MHKIAMGIDIGGSHITCQLVDLVKKAPLSDKKTKIPLDNNGSADSILDGWAKAIRKTARDKETTTLEGIGFAMPGPFDYLNGVALFKGVAKFKSLYGINVKTQLKKRLNLPENFRMRFLNDASSFAVGESWLGGTVGYKRSIALTLGTGFGTTFIKNGLPIAGVDEIPDDGFLYHIPFKDSIADDYFSTRWFLNKYKEKTGEQVVGVKQLVELASKEDMVRKLFQEFGINLGVFLASWVKRFKAEAIVLGGNISKSFHLFSSGLEVQLRNFDVSPVLSVSKMGENAALAGSARLCDDTFYNRLLKTKIIR